MWKRGLFIQNITVKWINSKNKVYFLIVLLTTYMFIYCMYIIILSRCLFAVDPQTTRHILMYFFSKQYPICSSLKGKILFIST